MNFNYSPKNRCIDDVVEFNNENIDDDGKTCSDVLSEGTNVGDGVDRDCVDTDVDGRFNDCGGRIDDNFNNCDIDVDDKINDCDSRVKEGINVADDNCVEIKGETDSDGIGVNGVEGCNEILVECWDCDKTDIVGADDVNDDFANCDEDVIRSCDGCSEGDRDVNGDIDDTAISVLKENYK